MTEFCPHDLPEFQTWSQSFSPPADATAYIAQHMTTTMACLFADLLLPKLVLVRDCVLLASRYEPGNFEEWWTRTGGDQASVERAINHVHLWDLFEPNGESEERALHELASRIARVWRWHAEHEFPERSFVVAVTDEYGPTVVLSSHRLQNS